MAKPTSKTESRWRTELWELQFVIGGPERRRFIKRKHSRARRQVDPVLLEEAQSFLNEYADDFTELAGA